ncbi:MFS transporter [Aureimonas sp. SK2]|uniref:MFS transporter n=1 Tax=Aureimonas sp. SK2 TaxID=3015992 RepID=UPI0032612254
MGRFIADNARWLAGGFLLTLFSSFGQTFFISLSNPGIREAYGLTHGEFGGLYMLATLGSAFTLPFLGRVIDRYRTTTVAAGTIAMLAVATMAMGLSASLPFLVLSLYLLRLFGQGMMTQTALTATGRWFAANRGRAVSLVTLGQQAGEASFRSCSSSSRERSAGDSPGSRGRPPSFSSRFLPSGCSCGATASR